MTYPRFSIFGRPKANKFRAVRTELDGYKFDSKREAAVYAELKLRERAKEVCGLSVHPKFQIAVRDHHIADYTADFQFYETAPGDMNAWRLRVIDVKSPPTAKKRDFILIRKLMKAVHGIDVEVWN